MKKLKVLMFLVASHFMSVPNAFADKVWVDQSPIFWKNFYAATKDKQVVYTRPLTFRQFKFATQQTAISLFLGAGIISLNIALFHPAFHIAPSFPNAKDPIAQLLNAIGSGMIMPLVYIVSPAMLALPPWMIYDSWKVTLKPAYVGWGLPDEIKNLINFQVKFKNVPDFEEFYRETMQEIEMEKVRRLASMPGERQLEFVGLNSKLEMVSAFAKLRDLKELIHRELISRAKESLGLNFFDRRRLSNKLLKIENETVDRETEIRIRSLELMIGKHLLKEERSGKAFSCGTHIRTLTERSR